MNARVLPGLVSVAVVALVGACQEPNSPPSIDFVADSTVIVGEGLRLPLRAVDPDGDRVTFTVAGLPDAATVLPTADDAALLYWNPSITDTEPGGRRYEVVVSADDGRGGTATVAFDVTVVAAFGAPVFTLPAGVVVDLAQQGDLTLLVTVKDDDSVSVDIELVEGPEGAKLSKSGEKSAYMYWKPTEEQRESVVHRAVLRATDETHPPVDHVLILVLLGDADGGGCVGSPPTVLHEALADTNAGAAGVPIAVTARDDDSAVHAVEVHWTTGDPDGELQTTALEAQGGDIWSGTLPVTGVPAGGALLRYQIEVVDNDDPTGSACDRTTRLPKAGAFTAGVYPEGTPDTACIDDAAEPDGDLASAPSTSPGVLDGRRICGDDVDLAAVSLEPGQRLVAQVVTEPSHGTLQLRLLGPNGSPLAKDPSGGGTLSVTADAAGAGPHFVEVSALSTGARQSYRLTIGLEDVPCTDDALEDNDGPTAAATLEPGSHDLTVCPADDDWFAVGVGAGERLEVTAAFDQSYGDLDLELRAADGATILAASSGSGDAESAQWTAAAPATVLVRVYGHDGAANAYTLLVAREAAGAACEDDLLAPNGSAATAVTLLQGLYGSLKLCGEAGDWFTLDLNGGETLDLLAEPTGAGSVTIDVFEDPAAAPVATSTTDADGLAYATYAISQAGSLTYRVTGAAGTTYTLLQEVTDPEGPCQPDRFEPNDSADTAVEQTPGVITWLRLCGDERDAFALSVPPFAVVTALTSHASGGGYADLTLVGPDGATLAEALDPSDGAELEALVESGGVVTVLVDGYDVSETLGYDLALLVD